MWSLANREEFLACISDLIAQPEVQEMANVHQHVDVNCLEHCIFVSYISFLFCKRFGLNFVDAARGALLHDLFLYDWHIIRGCTALLIRKLRFKTPPKSATSRRKKKISL